MKAATREAVLALVRGDGEATEEERAAVEAACAGVRIERPLSIREAAALIGCHRNTVAKLVVARRLATVVLGDGGRRIVRSSLEEYMQGRTAAGRR